MKQKLLGYFLVLWGVYFVVAVIQDPFEDYAPSSGYLGTAYTVVNVIFSLVLLAMAVVLLLLGRRVLGKEAGVSAKQKLLGYFLVLWGAGWLLNAILLVLPNHGYWKTTNTVVFVISSLVFLATAVVLLLLGRRVLGKEAGVSAKQKLLGYFLVLWGSVFFLTPIQEELRSHDYWGTTYTGTSIILSLVFLAMAVVLLLLGRRVLGKEAGVLAKQKLLGYFLVLWGAGWLLNAILNIMPSGGYWKTVDFGYNIIAYPVFLAIAVVLLLLGRKVLGNETGTSAWRSRSKKNALS